MATTAQLIDILACDKVDSLGNPLSGYQVRTYASDGSTPANVWETRAKTTPKAQFVLSATGYAEVYGDNTYIIKIWADTADPDVDTPYLTIGPVTYSFDTSGDVTGDITGDVYSTDGTKVLENGTNGTDATFLGVASESTLAASSTKIGTLNIKIIEMGDWDMDTDATLVVAHGLDDQKIRLCFATVRDDLATKVSQFSPTNDLNNTSGYIQLINSTNVNLARTTGGDFDNISHDSTGYNRGWVTIYYID